MVGEAERVEQRVRFIGQECSIVWGLPRFLLLLLEALQIGHMEDENVRGKTIPFFASTYSLFAILKNEFLRYVLGKV